MNIQSFSITVPPFWRSSRHWRDPVFSPSASLPAPDCQLIGRTSACRSQSLGDQRVPPEATLSLDGFSHARTLPWLFQLRSLGVSWLCLRREPSPILRAWQDSSLARAPPPRGPRFEHDNPCGLYTCGSRASLVPRGFRYCGPDRWLFAVVVGVYQLCTAAPLPPSTPPPHQPPPPLPACLGLSCMLL